MKKIALINGPNLNKLGERQPSIYGYTKLVEIEKRLTEKCEKNSIILTCKQSNHEGEIIDFIQTVAEDHAAAIINPGSLMMNGFGLLDAILGSDLTFIEVHISNIYAREEFRHKSILAHACQGQISGLGVDGYDVALEYLIKHLKS